MLPDLKDNISLPKVATRPPLLRCDDFVPVIRTRRYNLIKIKDLCLLKERDIRLGRVKTESTNLQKLLTAEDVQRQSQEAYRAKRDDRSRQMHNHSYLSLMEKIKYELRHWSTAK
jgi:hypothetical protein